MEHQFDFDNIGKRMPYSVPEGFFDDMKRQILARNLSQSHPRRHRYLLSVYQEDIFINE